MKVIKDNRDRVNITQVCKTCLSELLIEDISDFTLSKSEVVKGGSPIEVCVYYCPVCNGRNVFSATQLSPYIKQKKASELVRK